MRKSQAIICVRVLIRKMDFHLLNVVMVYYFVMVKHNA